MLRKFCYILMISALVGGSPLAAQTSSKDAIQSTIQDQISALHIDDYEAAFDFASKQVQQLFGSADRFGRMVERGYPMVHRSNAVRFLEFREHQGQVLQKVQMRDAQGALHHLLYHMVHNGSVWKINGVRVLKTAGADA